MLHLACCWYWETSLGTESDGGWICRDHATPASHPQLASEITLMTLIPCNSAQLWYTQHHVKKWNHTSIYMYIVDWWSCDYYTTISCLQGHRDLMVFISCSYFRWQHQILKNSHGLHCKDPALIVESFNSVELILANGIGISSQDWS